MENRSYEQPSLTVYTKEDLEIITANARSGVGGSGGGGCGFGCSCVGVSPTPCLRT